MILQYFGSNGSLINSGFNHTLVLQCLVCVAFLPIFFHVSRKKILVLLSLMLILVLSSVIHYEIISRVNDYIFDIVHAWSYAKFYFYFFVYVVVYYFFEDKDFYTIVKVAKCIVLFLFFESLLYLTFKTLGLLSLAELFVSVEGRFAGIFLMQNTLVGLFALFVMSYHVFYGDFLEKLLYLTIGVFLIILTGERSLFLGLLLLSFFYILFCFDKNNDITKDKLKIFLFFSVVLVFFAVLFTIFIRGYNIQSLGEFLRPITLRLYYSYLAIVHIFESNNSIFGFGPFIENIPTNYSDLYSDYVEKFINIVAIVFGEVEEVFFKNFHDSGNTESPSYIVNAHNTFILFFFKFGYIFIALLFYLLYTLFISFSDIKTNPRKFFVLNSNANEIKNKNVNFFLPSSIIFIFSSLPSVFFLSLDNYLILVIIALGQIGSYNRHE